MQAEQQDAQQALTGSLTAGFVGANAFVADGSSGGERRLMVAAPKPTPKATAARVTRTKYTPSWKLYKVLRIHHSRHAVPARRMCCTSHVPAGASRSSAIAEACWRAQPQTWSKQYKCWADAVPAPFTMQPKTLASVYCLSRGVASAGKTALQMATLPIPAGTSSASGTWAAAAAAGTAAVTVAGPTRSRICPANVGVRATAAGAGGAAGAVCCAARAICDNKAADVYYVQTGLATGTYTLPAIIYSRSDIEVSLCSGHLQHCATAPAWSLLNAGMLP